ncbi:MAG: peptide chain release factor N(5)-glutamine methyltransferase [Propionibacteriaceae bacterium]|nr:peptide chain release factor N(5)-glutamine methyltransferase [Propionibacteriaceae bacterium]
MELEPVPVVLRRLAARLAAAGVGPAAAEARLLAAHVLGCPPVRLDLAAGFDPAAAARLEALAAKRAAGCPLQHLTGCAPFRTATLAVGPGVFIPRPETEVMTGWLLGWLARSALKRPALVVELCAGSGAISLAIALEASGQRQWAVENAAAALPYLERNLAGVPVTVVAADMAAALPSLDGQVDAVIANPPYLPAAAWAELPADVRGFDPKSALVSGPDGLAATRVVAATAARLLRPGGVVASEHDDSHGLAAPAVFAAAGFADLADHLDLTGRPRFATAVWPGSAGASQAGADRAAAAPAPAGAASPTRSAASVEAAEPALISAAGAAARAAETAGRPRGGGKTPGRADGKMMP